MKAVFLALLLVNLLVMAWRMWIVPSEAPPAFVEAQDVPPLVLVGEDPDEVKKLLASTAPAAGTASATVADNNGQQQSAATDPQPGQAQQTESQAPGGSEAVPAKPDLEAAAPEQPPASVETEVAVAAAEKRCVSLGPFLNLREATEATAKLNEIELEPKQRLSESQVWFGHWVHLPPYPSREAAVVVVESLRKKGVNDIYIEPSGPMRHSVSLGVFSDAAHAETRAGQIRRLGVSPQIRDRYRDSSVYWVDFALTPGLVINPADYQANPSRVLRLEGRECIDDAG